ncbi:MAG: hypothetical protein ACLRY7_03970 [Hominenteromicrobium sp.]|uniref:hypothetical protein n=1 Tax=Hominenteromicrobium sp. TaxID=3073581 RepID=UPI0039A206F6
MFHKKISYFLVLTFCFLLFLPSCSNNVDTPEQSIQRVLTTIFTCPDNEAKEYGKILNKNKYSLEQENSQTEIAEAEKRMQEHLCQKYSKDDFTEAYYNSLFKHLYTSLAFPTMCILNEAEISPISVTVEKRCYNQYLPLYRQTKCDKRRLQSYRNHTDRKSSN